MKPCWLPGDIDLTPGTPCLLYGRPAEIIRRSIYPDRVYVHQDQQTKAIPIGPHWYADSSDARPIQPGSEGLPIDPCVVIA